MAIMKKSSKLYSRHVTTCSLATHSKRSESSTCGLIYLPFSWHLASSLYTSYAIRKTDLEGGFFFFFALLVCYSSKGFLACFV